ncbi:MAG TPA: hypothetical protein VIT65_21055 [Microlunatus sp.]
MATYIPWLVHEGLPHPVRHLPGLGSTTWDGQPLPTGGVAIRKLEPESALVYAVLRDHRPNQVTGRGGRASRIIPCSLLPSATT